MTSPRGPLAGSPPPATSAKGLVVVVVAVLVGLLLLARGFADDGGLIASDGDRATTTTAPDDDAEPGDDTAVDPDDDGTDTTVPLTPARPPEETTVLVLNASGVSGAAGRVRDALLAANYNPLAPGNAPERVPDTRIFFDVGWQSEAVGIATLLGAPVASVAPLPEPPPVAPGEAVVVVLLGEDQVIAVAG